MVDSTTHAPSFHRPAAPDRHPRRGPVAPPLFPLRGHRPASTVRRHSGTSAARSTIRWRIVPRRMRVSATTTSPPESGADTLAIGVFDGETIAHDVKGEALQRLIDAGEARTAFRHVAVAHADDKRWLIVGLGPRDGFGAERA